MHHDVHRHHALDPEGARFLGDAGPARAVHHLGYLHRLRRRGASVGGWPAQVSLETLIVSEVVLSILHIVDIILVVTEIIVLMTMVLSFLGAGNVTAKAAASVG